MLCIGDLDPAWVPEDVALFVAFVAAFEHEAKHVARFHGRDFKDPRVRHFVCKALMNVVKGQHIDAGLEHGDLARELIDYEERLKGELAILPQANRELCQSFHGAGRA